MFTDFNIILGIDAEHERLNVMTVKRGDVSSAEVATFQGRHEKFVKGDWAGIISETLPEFLSGKTFKSPKVFLVLPDRTVGTDIITVPVIKHAKADSAIETRMSDLYPFRKNYKINKRLISSTKNIATYETVMLEKALQSSIYKAFSEYKIYPKVTTFSANTTLNAVLALRPKTRKSSFIFLDVKDTFSNLVVAMNGCLVGFSKINFGLNALKDYEVVSEYDLIDNSLAEVAVINAIEKAKNKRMTVIEDDDENLIDEQSIKSDAVTDASLTIDCENAVGAEQEITATETPKQKAYVKKVKKLPQYFLRPVPETNDGFVTENFRLFLKRLLLTKMQIEHTEYFTAPEFALVNLPEKYSFVIDETNKEDNGLDLKYFNPDKDGNVNITDNLELYGAIYSSVYNKTNNF